MRSRTCSRTNVGCSDFPIGQLRSASNSHPPGRTANTKYPHKLLCGLSSRQYNSPVICVRAAAVCAVRPCALRGSRVSTECCSEQRDGRLFRSALTETFRFVGWAMAIGLALLAICDRSGDRLGIALILPYTLLYRARRSGSETHPLQKYLVRFSIIPLLFSSQKRSVIT
jgi:hypothetical protein